MVDNSDVFYKKNKIISEINRNYIHKLIYIYNTYFSN